MAFATWTVPLRICLLDGLSAGGRVSRREHRRHGGHCTNTLRAILTIRSVRCLTFSAGPIREAPISLFIWRLDPARTDFFAEKGLFPTLPLSPGPKIVKFPRSCFTFSSAASC